MKCPQLVGIALIAACGATSCTPTKTPDTATVPAAVAPAPTEDVEAIVTQLERDWVRAIVAKDAAALDRILADDFVGTSPSAHSFRKTDAIEDLKSGRYVVESMELDEISVKAYGTMAVSFTRQLEKSRYDGKDVGGRYRFTDVWANRDGRWQVVASHGSRFDAGPGSS